MELDELAVDHDYYASDDNHYSNDAVGRYNTWIDFYEDFKDADIDLNLVYRWDVYKRESSEEYYMKIVMILQRKGIYMPIHIKSVENKDVEQILKFMKPHFEKLLKIWQPMSNQFLNSGDK